MGAFLALQAKRVRWSTLVKRPQLNRVHTVNVNAADIPSFVQNFAGKSLKFIPVVKPQSFSSCKDQIQRLARAMALDVHFAGCNMRASRHVRTFLGSLWCPDLPPAPQAGIHTYVRLTCRELAQAWQSHMMRDEPLSHNLSALDRKAIDWLRCNRWVRLIDTDKNLGTALVESQWIEDQVQIWLSKMTRRISEAEASQKIVTCVQSLNVITERAIKSECIEEKQRGFLLVNSRSTVAPSFRILAKIHKQPVSSRPIGNYRNFCLGTAGVFLSSYLQPVVASCRHVIGSHVPIINWAETARLEEHEVMFTFDIEALYPSIQVWPGEGGLCLFDVVERAIRSFYSPQPDFVEFLVRLLHLVLSTQLTQYGGSFFEVTWGLSTGLQCASELANLYLDVLDSHVWQNSGGALKCLFRYIDDGFGVLDTRKFTFNELQSLLNSWNTSIKVPSIETSCPLPYLDLALEKLSLPENSRKFGVKFSTFRKKLNIYSYVPGDSDHHPSMMQSTIRGELTRLLRTNSSVRRFEREVKFFLLKWTRRGHDGREFDRIAKSYPWLAKKSLLGKTKRVKQKPFVYKISHSRGLRHFPFRKVINCHVKVVERFLSRECKPIVARTVSPNLFRRMYSTA